MKFILTYYTNLFLLKIQDFKTYEILLLTFVPIMIYPNAETDKSKILSDNKGRAVIYMWTLIR